MHSLSAKRCRACDALLVITPHFFPQAFGSPRPQHPPCSSLLHLSFEDGSLETLTLVLRWCYMGSLESALVAPLLRNVAVVEEALHAADMLLLSDMQARVLVVL